MITRVDKPIRNSKTHTTAQQTGSSHCLLTGLPHFFMVLAIQHKHNLVNVEPLLLSKRKSNLLFYERQRRPIAVIVIQRISEGVDISSPELCCGTEMTLCKEEEEVPDSETLTLIKA